MINNYDEVLFFEYWQTYRTGVANVEILLSVKIKEEIDYDTTSASSGIFVSTRY